VGHLHRKQTSRQLSELFDDDKDTLFLYSFMFITLAWTAPASPGSSPITSYRVYRGTRSGGETLFTTVANVGYADTSAKSATTRSQP
jgi:hypothetical protein